MSLSWKAQQQSTSVRLNFKLEAESFQERIFPFSDVCSVLMNNGEWINVSVDSQPILMNSVKFVQSLQLFHTFDLHSELSLNASHTGYCLSVKPTHKSQRAKCHTGHFLSF